MIEIENKGFEIMSQPKLLSVDIFTDMVIESQMIQSQPNLRWMTLTIYLYPIFPIIILWPQNPKRGLTAS